MSRRSREWGAKDVDMLELGLRLGMSIEEIARQIKRGVHECRDKAVELKLHIAKQTEGTF